MNSSRYLASIGLLGTLFVATGAQAKDWPDGFSKCADEGGTCKPLPTSRQVSFGIKDHFVVLTLSGSVACTTETFGSDPFPGKDKKCAVGPVVASAPSPAPSPAPAPAPSPSPAPAPSPSPAPSPAGDASTEIAPSTGWAGQAGGTVGGSRAAAGAVFKVSSPSQLKAALLAQKGLPRIIEVTGIIDMTAADNGGPFTSSSDQAKRNAITLPSFTTLIGAGAQAQIVNANIVVKKVDNVIVRNLSIVNPCDIAPEWDPTDGATGNWNSQYDGITVDGSTHVWIDHNSFTDAPVTDDTLPIENGKIRQCHDGALDIKNASDYVTVSNNLFELHQKNNLVGSSDSDTGDDGHLTVTFDFNWFRSIGERSPRVRFGRVHVYNNYYEGDRSAAVYAQEYSLGVGFKAKIISQNNVFDIAGASKCDQVVKNPGSSSKTGAITDAGSLLEGQPLNLSTGCSFASAVAWTVPYAIQLLPSTSVHDFVTSNAGTGKLTVK